MATNQPEAYLDAEFELLVHQLLLERHVPGVSIAVVEDGRIWTKGYGFARLPDIPADAKTLYCIGSLTKAMLAAGMGCAMNDPTSRSDNEKKSATLNKARWQTPIKDILGDDFVLEDPIACDNTTIEDALSHRTGFSGADYMYGRWMGLQPTSIIKAMRYLGPLSRPFRTAFQYNNLMYSTVAGVLETVTGKGWGAALRHYLWRPLGMDSTFWHFDEIPEEQQKNLARGYFWTTASGNAAPTSSIASPGGSYSPEVYLDFAGIAPAGSVISNVEDCAKWVQELLEASVEDSENSSRYTTNSDHEKHRTPAITRSLFADLTTPRTFHLDSSVHCKNSQMQPRTYSLGWFHLPSTAGLAHPVMAHGGGLTGFGSQLYMLPSDNFGCVVLTNSMPNGGTLGERLCHELLARKLRLVGSAKDEFKRTLASSPYPTTEEDGVDAHGDEMEKAEEDQSAKGPTPAGLQAKRHIDVDNDVVKDKEAETETLDPQTLKRILGRYTNPAYGEYELITYKHGSESEIIVYNGKLAADTVSNAEDRDSRARVLSFLPVGHRSWNNRFLLRLPSSSVQPQTTAAGSSLATTMMDLEFFNLHGMPVSDEPTSGSDQRLKFPIWQSEGVSIHGAAVPIPSKEHTEEHGQVSSSQRWRIGLRLGNAYSSTDGTTAEGFEDEMVWFEKTA